MKSARINFGIPDSEYILELDDSGAATSLVNQDTGTEYVGGGGSDNSVLFVEEDENGSIGVSYNDIKSAIDNNILPIRKYTNETEVGVVYLNKLIHNEGGNYIAEFGGDSYSATIPTDPLVFTD